MNICIITPRYPYKDNMEFVFVKKLVDEWAKMGHRCVVITDYSLTAYLRKHIDYKPKYYCDVVAPSIHVDVYNPRTVSTKIKVGNFSLDNWLSVHAVEKQLKKIGIKFDLIYCHFFGSSLRVFRYAKNNNIPLFLASGESEVEKLGKPFSSFEWSDYRNYVRGVVAVSTKNKTEALELGMIDSEKCNVFPNGTDLSRFRRLDRQACRKELGFPKDAFIVLCVGYLCRRKGQDRVLAAINKLKDDNIKLVFVGGYFGNSDDLFLEGDNILFKGKADNAVLPKYYNAADVFCLPTLAEGCCNAIIEALACGLPIVSSNLPFNRDVLDKGNSILVDPNNIDEISEAIKVLQNSDSIRQRLGENALKKAENLSVSHRANSIMDFIMDKI